MDSLRSLLMTKRTFRNSQTQSQIPPPQRHFEQPKSHQNSYADAQEDDVLEVAKYMNTIAEKLQVLEHKSAMDSEKIHSLEKKVALEAKLTQEMLLMMCNKLDALSEPQNKTRTDSNS